MNSDFAAHSRVAVAKESFNSCLVGLSLACFLRQVVLCSSGCPRSPSVDQVELDLRDLPDSAVQVLGLKACTTTVQEDLCN